MRIRNYLAGAVALLFLITPSVSSAQTASDLQAQIAALLAQVAALQGQSAPSSATTVQVLSPNGGETYKAGSNDLLTVKWTAKKVPSGSIACVNLYTWSPGPTGHSYSFPSTGECITARNGSQKITGKLIQTPGYDLGPGLYRAQVSIVKKAPVGGKDGPTLADDASDANFTLTGPSAQVETATIDAGSLLQVASTSFKLSGTATNVVNNYGNVLSIAYRPLGNNGPTGGGYVTIENGLWKWPAGTSLSLPAGSYAVQVSDPQSTLVLATGTLVVKTASGPAPTCTLMTVPTGPLPLGDAITISWYGANADYVILPDGSKGAITGRDVYTPLTNTTYQYTFVGAGGTTICAKAVTVTGSTGSLDTFSYSPTSGTVPLTITVNGTTNAKKSCGGGNEVLSFDDQSTYQISFPADLCQTKSWTVTHTYTSANDYILGLYAGTKPGGSALHSGLVHVTAGATTPTRVPASITITYPDWSSITSNGSAIPINWTSTNVGNYPIEIDLLPKAGGTSYVIARNVTNSGTYQWIPSASIPNGTYRILVTTMTKEGTSDGAAGTTGYFSFTKVITPTITPEKNVCGTGLAKFGACQIEASAYLSLLSAVAAIQAQLNELIGH